MSISKHKLYNRWFKLKSRNLLCDSWLDFNIFIQDVPENVSKMLRKDDNFPHSVENSTLYFRTDESKLERKSRILKEFHRRNPNKQREYKLNGLYGLSQEDYDRILDSQGGVCCICGNKETVLVKGSVKALAVDHCHTTGRVRGILCQSCNKALGLFKDDIQLLQNAITYLKD